ncbi:DUF4249 domain-containing protein [Confluentibacter citreus]|uniref:DUF4249 domain-containing protein n=1 Tax=Confluentibacter citreus TaxID=2007307 RepID=UPI000C29550E|nr:DUF4249 domain-containing protein [Confluentibacter citreus]
MPTKPILFHKIIVLTLSFTLLTCTNPVSPEYQFIEGLIYIEGFVGTTEGSSFVTITESDVAVYYRNIFVSGANVYFVNANSAEKIPLFEDNSQYIPDPNFKGELGENWFLEVNLPNGKQYLSEIETINPSVPIKEINVRYDKQLEFVEDYKKYAPGHEVSVTFDDPENQTNYYYWRFKTYDKAQICKICERGYFRDNCIPFDPFFLGYREYYTYWCESDCWQIEFGNKIHIFSDEFSNGATTSSLPVANVYLTRKSKILVELQQFSLTPKAYEYYRTIKDLIDNNGGFNAPLPAALIGNMYNPEDSNEYVLGRFTASSATTKQIMIDRTMIEDQVVGTQLKTVSENQGDPGLPVDILLVAPCEESKYRTSTEPEGWIE